MPRLPRGGARILVGILITAAAAIWLVVTVAGTEVSSGTVNAGGTVDYGYYSQTSSTTDAPEDTTVAVYSDPEHPKNGTFGWEAPFVTPAVWTGIGVLVLLSGVWSFLHDVQRERHARAG